MPRRRRPEPLDAAGGRTVACTDCGTPTWVKGRIQAALPVLCAACLAARVAQVEATREPPKPGRRGKWPRRQAEAEAEEGAAEGEEDET